MRVVRPGPNGDVKAIQVPYIRTDIPRGEEFVLPDLQEEIHVVDIRCWLPNEVEFNPEG